ncbi:hypothetical protein A1O3_09563 [Capronia epimyces CBS 606.96]|uniref:Trafficking protein particle complex II-specific subunit 65 IgD3 domain-containing protein n=1 Tax=Capronia epimyces CBS 606.96 TaxID=1182542 RepID=W9XA62_9EURO|nr:uncharacterized protein A1O3_09563 [Capronia epimyces CBS 606.96]EXJ77337.1 hypothetical protein A1O3_09563 [Capronia epimyces CBS 606.96]
MESEFFKASLLDAVIPDDTVTGVSQLVGADGEILNDNGRLLTIKEREILFFVDEQLRTYAVLRLPHCDEDTLKTLLSRLSFKIDVWAFDDSVRNELDAAAPPPKDLVFTLENIQENEPIVLASQSPDRGQTLTLIWEVELAINRPRLRTSQTSIVLVPSGIITAAEEGENGQNTDLTPFQPLDSNVLEPMRLIPGLDRTPPYLAASRLERVLPVASRSKPRIHIPQVPSRRHRAVPAVIARVHYSKLSTFSPSMTNLALLDIEIIPYIPVEAVVEHIDLVLGNGRTESVMPEFLPMHCRSGDCLTFMYKLYQGMDSGVPLARAVVNPNVDILSIKVRVEVTLSSRCRPVVIMAWTTHVDFTQALNPAFGPPAQPIQRANRPASLPVSSGNGPSTAMIATATSPQPTYDVALRSGLSITFTASDAPVYVGQAFTWKILVVNNSPTLAKIAIIPLPRIHRQTTQAQLFARRHAPKSSTASFHPSERRHTKSGEDADIAQAVVDENVVYAMHHSNLVPPETDLMTLTAELRIGPLAPGQCHESEIQMVAFESGTLRVDAMRVVDLIQEAGQENVNTSVMADIRSLPDVVAKSLAT